MTGKKRIIILSGLLVIAAAVTITVGFTLKGTLRIAFPQMDQSQKNFITPLITAFELETGIEVDYQFIDTVDLYKEIQKEEPSVELYYFISNYSLRKFQSEVLLEELPLDRQEGIDNLFFSNPYYLPISWYPWGFYYDESLFNEQNLTEPHLWDGFLTLSKTIAKNDVYPSSLMTKIKWPSTIWFDYMNIRLNGLEYHQRVLNGEIPFTEDKVVKVFEEILSLHQSEYFHMITDSFEWSDLRSDVASGQTAMSLSGAFFYTDGLSWFPFPETSTLIASSSGFVQSKDSGNKRVVKKFLQFVLSEKGQQIIQNNSELISIRSDVAQLLKRPDIEKAFSVLTDYNSMSPSFERNTHDELILPLKSAINSLYSIENKEELFTLLQGLEDYRKSL